MFSCRIYGWKSGLCIILLLLFTSTLILFQTSLQPLYEKLDVKDSDLSDASLKKINAVYRSRYKKMLDACARFPIRYTGIRGYAESRILVNPTLKFSYCPIQKTASTFWRALIRNVSRATASKTYHLNDLTIEQQHSAIKDSTMFMFARDPYKRLFSGYVNKIFSPNAMYWKLQGKPAVKIVRKNATQKELMCGHDVTFREFVKFVIYSITRGYKKDGHFSPQHEHCDPCKYHYNAIGKLESIENDTIYIISKFAKTSFVENVKLQFHKSHILTVIQRYYKWLFYFRNKYKNCLSFYDAQRLTWKTLQANGFLDKTSIYPVLKSHSENVSKEELIQIAANNIGNVVDPAVARRNKKESFLEAYSTVDKNDLEQLRKIFQPDCDIFGYDCKPNKLFKNLKLIRPWYFDLNTA